MIRILYVDDEPVLLNLGKIFLERAGDLIVNTVESPLEALDMLREDRYDAIISDLQMPDMNGIEFLKKIRASGDAIPFIIFTGRGREEVVIEALNNGADHYLQKGGDPHTQFTELIHNIRRAVERKRANDTIFNLNRLYSVVSRTNRAIVHIRNRQDLLDEACRIAVEEGKFLMAWIGMVDPVTRKVYPVAACGYEADYLSKISVSVDNIPQGMGLTGIAIREGHPTVSNDIPSDPRMCGYRDEAAKRGYRSSAAFPLWNGNVAIGAMRFYSGEPNFFNDRELALIQELTDDISFALRMTEREEIRRTNPDTNL